MSFAEIDYLIEQKSYNEALDMLDAYIRKNPKDFDNAQRRIEQIIKARKEYTDLAAELLNVIQNEPMNDLKKLEMIAQLEKLEKKPNPAAQAFIRETKAASQFTFYKAKFNEIMTEGSRLYSEKKYEESITVFLSGMDLYRNEFYEQNYSPSITEPVQKAAADIASSAARYQQVSSSFLENAAVFKTKTAQGNIDEAEISFSALKKSFSEFIQERNTIANAGWLMKQTFDFLQEKNSALTEASYLPFAYRFTLGRANDETTGILASFEQAWKDVLKDLENAVSQMPDAALSAAVKAVPADSFFKDASLFSAARKYIEDAQRTFVLAYAVSDLYSLADESLDKKMSTSQPLFRQSVTYAQELSANLEAFFNLNEKMIQLQTSLRSAAAAPDQIDEDLSAGSSQYVLRLASLSKLNDEYRSSAATIAQQAAENFALYTTIRSKAENPSPAVKPWSVQYLYLEKNAAAYDKAAQINTDTVWSAVSYYVINVGNTYEKSYADKYAQALLLLNPENLRLPDAASTASYPEKTLPILKEMSDSYVKDNALLTELLKFTEKETPSAFLSSETSRLSAAAAAGLRQNISKLAGIIADSKNVTQQALARIAAAEKARSEGDLRYRQAAAALNTENFASARRLAQAARTSYNASLAWQESSELRTRSDEILTELGYDITRRENELVVREVRELKTQAKEAYYAANFDKAENILLQAQTRWFTTNVEDDQEIINLLSLVNTAVSMKTGRTIPPTAPLYPEMSQILSTANQYYDRGKQLSAEGKQEEAAAVLNDAKTKLRELQLVYPLNQDASLLTLRIDQLIDPKAFDSLFSQKLAAAKSDYKNPAKQQTAYADLLDLYEIRKTEEIRRLIYTVEIDLGIRMKPQDEASMRKARTLTAEAQKLFDTAKNDQTILQQALVKLDQAIKEDPNNKNAAALKDKIQTVIGGQAVAVLSAESEALYQRAVQELNNNKPDKANDIIQQLLAVPENKRSTKILSLKKKVESFLL